MSWQHRRLVQLRRSGGDASASIEQELAGERAAVLGRVGRRLGDAIERWRRLSAHRPSDDPEVATALAEVSDAAWMLIIQRECSGFRSDNLGWIRRHYDVPPGALEQMGARRADAPREAGRRGSGVPWWDELQGPRHRDPREPAG